MPTAGRSSSVLALGLCPGSADAQPTLEMLLCSHPAILETRGGRVAGTALPLSLGGRKGLGGGSPPEMATGHFTPRPAAIAHSGTSHSSLPLPWAGYLTSAMPLAATFFSHLYRMGVGLDHH